MSLVPYVGRCVTCGHNHGDPFAAAPIDAGELPVRNVDDGATFEDYRNALAVGNLTPVDQMAFDNLLHEVLATQHRAAVDEAMITRAIEWCLKESPEDAEFVGISVDSMESRDFIAGMLTAALQEPKA